MADMTISEINANLIKISKDIAIKSNEIDIARSEYLQAKDEYEHEYSKSVIFCKTTDPNATQTDIKAMAIDKTYQKKLDMRVKEAKYRSLMSGLKSLRDQLESLYETSYNIRAELRLTSKGQYNQ